MSEKSPCLVDDDMDSSDGEDDHELFSGVMQSMNLDLLPHYVTVIRKRSEQSEQDDAETNPNENKPIDIESPLFGSYHVLYPVKFHDGVRWLLKVPVNGTRDRFDGLASRALRSEALTMRLLQRETDIPVPDVFAFSDTCDNELNCPFILMNFISGKPLYDCWFDKSSPKEVVDERRTRALQDIAVAMIQLEKFSFEQGGSIDFDEASQPAGIGPSRYVDNRAMLDRMRTEDPDEFAIYLQLGPFQTSCSFYTALLDSRPVPSSDFEKGLREVLRLFIQWIPEPDNAEKSFVLAHPDFDIQNAIVSEDGSLQGLIDWDGVCAVPRSIGNERYPSWLTRDWDRAMYGWKEEMEHGVKPIGVWEDSPKTLTYYRQVYEAAIQSILQEKGVCSPGHQGSDPRITLTHNSLIAENLYIAATDPLCMLGILDKIFDKIVELVRPHHGDVEDELDDFSIYNIACALAAGDLDDRRFKILRQGFESLLKWDGK